MAEGKKLTNLTNEEFVEKNMVMRKNVFDRWEASFTCADGYQISCSGTDTGRTAKKELKERLIQRVLMQFKHPIQ